ncbi:hypothetical protein SEA_GIRR_70 [Mycobacterium phage Girr]|uniref:Helix-turn-helix DNA binding domain protein n=2 Tax=Cheoctovirus TaxID=1623281 RepID=A0A345MH12_9CAUD|nr:replication initiation protein [Mycobacterium phage Girr]YP_009958924.1 replication initiation protein [Mycobacterium phage Krakatau]AXQ65077.1 hypothetical protein SEA_RUBY_68 [Mycobacterium phage Ruby]QAY06107.1 hypothetical protein SEA_MISTERCUDDLES_70 [Mycobacterium phage MisterCuddles]AXH69843.1 hypothetical protein SEA_KRAKATAU_68 [Mycobacterium phage Krakatau]AXQ61019.1 hypothetical protein SEA_GIRR_70 [Mycobacterium phage Girr]
MRIRSTKPEFWRSRTIAQLDWDTRLVLKALESYVDDNGVGKDNVVLFCADAFPHDLAKSSEICAKVSRSLSRLSEAGLIVRYSISGEELVYVRHWKKWQYIDKPNKGRYQRPDGTKDYREPVDESIGAGQGVTDPVGQIEPSDIRETFANTARNLPEDCPQIQSGEQRNRGTEEQGLKDLSDPDGSDVPALELAVTEDDFPNTFRSIYPRDFEEWWQHYPRKDAKKSALEAWKRACKRASKQQLIAGAIRYANDPNRVPKFTKQPTTWLNGDCWLSESLPGSDDSPNGMAPGEAKVMGWLALGNDDHDERKAIGQ